MFFCCMYMIEKYNKLHQKNIKKFECKSCNFICSKKGDYTRHISTRKHQIQQIQQNDNNIQHEKTSNHICNHCGALYAHRASLYNHRKRCENHQNIIIKPQLVTGDEVCTPQTSDSGSKEIIQALLQDNREMRSLLVDLMKNNLGQTTNNHNNSHNVATNSHNKTFNLQFFLNETCKDAMNITDFVNSLKLTLQDLEKVGELGYAEGISRMFVRGLNDLEVTKRPIHCSDLKREILHIKDKDKWEKDDNQYKLKKAIKELSTKNIMLLDDWQKENPGCKDYNNQKNDIYLKMMVESLGPADATAEKKDFGKIIRTIAKNTIIAKED